MPFFASSGRATQFPPAAREFPGAAAAWKGVELVETPGRPANSPFWEGVDGNVWIRLAQNTETGVYTCIARVTGCPGVAAEHTNDTAALAQAIGMYATRQNVGPRARDITPGDRAEMAALLGRPDMMPGGV